MGFWNGKKVMVTGGAGFIGSHLVEMLVEKGSMVTVVDNLQNAEMKNLDKVKDKIELKTVDIGNLEECIEATRGTDVVMNLAAKVAGIEYNRKNPSEMFFSNIKLSANVLEASRINKVSRVLIVSSACVYASNCIIPTPENEGFRYVPEPTNDGYGWAKRIAEWQAISYAKEFGMNIAIARPYNAYGPRDHFDPEKSHVIASLIKKVFESKDKIEVWGDGEQSRAFLYVEDFAMGLIAIAEKYPVADPVNLGTDEEIKIKDLVNLIIKISGKKIEPFFDTTKPNGQPRRNCDNVKLREKIGFQPKLNLQEGLTKTIEWYKNNILK